MQVAAVPKNTPMNDGLITVIIDGLHGRNSLGGVGVEPERRSRRIRRRRRLRRSARSLMLRTVLMRNNVVELSFEKLLKLPFKFPKKSVSVLPCVPTS